MLKLLDKVVFLYDILTPQLKASQSVIFPTNCMKASTVPTILCLILWWILYFIPHEIKALCRLRDESIKIPFVWRKHQISLAILYSEPYSNALSKCPVQVNRARNQNKRKCRRTVDLLISSLSTHQNLSRK